MTVPDLTGRIALVTGASRGIGYSVARHMAAAGAHVIAVARTVGGLEELDDEIKAGTPIGRRIASLYESGQLVPDEIVVPLIEKKLERSKEVRGFIFKGFPRTLVQSYILDGLLLHPTND